MNECVEARLTVTIIVGFCHWVVVFLKKSLCGNFFCQVTLLVAEM